MFFINTHFCTFFVSIRLDGCNSLLAGVSSHILHKLQVIQNAATHLVTLTGTRRSEHGIFTGYWFASGLRSS